MKKMIYSFTTFACCLFFANNNKAQNITVPDIVQNSLEKKFRDAELVKWGLGRDAYVATLITYDGRIEAYFSEEGRFKGIGSIITEEDLPLAVKRKLTEYYVSYKVYQVYKFDCNETGPCYYISMKNFQKEMIVRIKPSGTCAIMKKCKIKKNKNLVA